MVFPPPERFALTISGCKVSMKYMKLSRSRISSMVSADVVRTAQKHHKIPMLTDDIVAILILAQLHNQALPVALVCVEERLQKVHTILSWCVLQAFLDDVAGKFVHAVALKIGKDQGEYFLPVFFLAVLDYMLDDVVAKLVSDQARHALMQFVHDPALSPSITTLKTSLDDAATVWVDAEALNLADESVDDEGDKVRRTVFNGFLDDMIAVLVLHALDDAVLELADKHGLLLGKDRFKSLIDYLLASYMTTYEVRDTGLTFCTTLQPYICMDRSRTRPLICEARIFFCSCEPCSKNFWIT